MNARVPFLFYSNGELRIWFMEYSDQEFQCYDELLLRFHHKHVCTEDPDPDEEEIYYEELFHFILPILSISNTCSIYLPILTLTYFFPAISSFIYLIVILIASTLKNTQEKTDEHELSWGFEKIVKQKSKSRKSKMWHNANARKNGTNKQNRVTFDSMKVKEPELELSISENNVPTKTNPFLLSQAVTKASNVDVLEEVITKTESKDCNLKNRNDKSNDFPKCCEMLQNGLEIQLKCSANCSFNLHVRCRNESIKTFSKKSLTGRERCLTPDCWGYVTSLVWKNQNGKINRTTKLNTEHKNDKPKLGFK